LPLYYQEFEVEGSGDFPMDMLRYDFCSPRREGDDTGNLYAPMYSRERLPVRRIQLKRLVTHKDKMPTSGRWASFGWRVIPETIKTRKTS